MATCIHPLIPIHSFCPCHCSQGYQGRGGAPGCGLSHCRHHHITTMMPFSFISLFIFAVVTLYRSISAGSPQPPLHPKPLSALHSSSAVPFPPLPINFLLCRSCFLHLFRVTSSTPFPRYQRSNQSALSHLDDGPNTLQLTDNQLSTLSEADYSFHSFWFLCSVTRFSGAPPPSWPSPSHGALNVVSFICTVFCFFFVFFFRK